MTKAKTANESVWAQAYKTDPTYTKNYKGAGGFQGTSVASLYPVQRATEIFGALGDGWGFEIIEDTFIPGGPIIDKETGAILCNEQTHSMRIKLWANLDGKKLESHGIGLTPHITTNKYGINTDHEAQKKSLTDAIKNGLVRWGFSADVYMGMHDDHAYVKAVGDDFALDKAEDRDLEALKQREEYEEEKERTKNTMRNAVTVNELEKVFKVAQITAKRKGDDDYIKDLVGIAKKRKAELTEESDK